MFTVSNVFHSIPVVLLGGGVIYWQMKLKVKGEVNCCTTQEECIEETKANSAEKKSNSSAGADGNIPEFAGIDSRPNQLDLSVLPCIRHRRSVFPKEYDATRRDVNPAVIQSLLDAALWSPFHGKSYGNPHPSRFVVRSDGSLLYLLFYQTSLSSHLQLDKWLSMFYSVFVLLLYTLYTLTQYHWYFVYSYSSSFYNLIIYHFFSGTWKKSNENNANSYA